MNLVSGATGFLGAHLVCTLLHHGEAVRACKRVSSSLKEFNFIFEHYFTSVLVQTEKRNLLTWVEADINDVSSLQVAMKDIHTVYHCAALVSFVASDRDRLMKINVEGTANMVNAALAAKVPVFCYASSVAALGRKKQGDVIDESAKWEESKYNSNYAISKYKAELEVWRGAEEGLKVCMVNPGVILGLGDYKKGSNAMVHTVYKGLPLYSMGVNGYVNVKDVARAMHQLVQQQIFGKRFVMVAESCQIRELFFMLADGFGVKRPFIKVTPFMAEIAWRIMYVVALFKSNALPITKETARAANYVSRYDAARIKKELNFEFISIPATVTECCQTYQQFINYTI